jgi:hypothetical protein|tara:strand:- start:3135 stop:3626 length:492 start_codon:yes stop_codon:yes gene_type:complete
MALTTFSGPVKSNNGFITGGAGSSVAITEPTTLTVAAHAGRTVLVSDADCVITLPSIVNVGTRETNMLGTQFNIYIALAATSLTIVTDGTDKYRGRITVAVGAAATAKDFFPADANDIITLNGSTQGGLVGTYLRITAIADNTYLVEATVNGSGAPITPFSGS